MLKGRKAGTVTDPVCGMRVEPAKAAASTVYEGRTYYFCAVSCRDQFVANPKAYV